ncbi:MAG TPA: hypothetical protein VN133_14495 [Humibacter sp.]|nr:hypothetical protein [Humibacter sp.]
MRTSRKILMTAALAGLAVFGAAAPAAVAAPVHATSAQLVGVVHQTGPTTAEVSARYTCTGTADQLHLWVSVKQTADRTADPALANEGSSQIAAAWSQSHAGVMQLVCDGKNHVASFTVDQTEQGFGTLAKGDAWVQFCLFDATTPVGPVSDMEFMHVR